MATSSDFYKTIPDLPDKITRKKKKPKLLAVVDEDNCTGCQVCIPFCPVDCIEPVPKGKYNSPIPPVQIRLNECIGCQICARVCTKLTWDAIRMDPTEKVEKDFNITVTESFVPPQNSS
jgi:electron transport complex protein RnfB